MSWKFPSRAFRISLGILIRLGDLPLDRFSEHVSYLILMNDVASGGNVEELFLFFKNKFIPLV
jgi:hypothetical protein